MHFCYYSLSGQECSQLLRNSVINFPLSTRQQKANGMVEGMLVKLKELSEKK